MDGFNILGFTGTGKSFIGIVIPSDFVSVIRNARSSVATRAAERANCASTKNGEHGVFFS
jgi:hypothetical protein